MLTYPLLLISIVIGFIAITGGFGDQARVWITLLAIAATWAVTLIGAAGSYPILKVGAALSVVYQVGFIGCGIWALFQGDWGVFWVCLLGAIVTPLVGGTFLVIHEKFERIMMARQLGALSQSDWSRLAGEVRRDEGLD